MHDEVAHMGVIDGLLGFRLPGSIGGGIVGINANDVELVEIPEFHNVQIGELAPEDEVQQLSALALIRHWLHSSLPGDLKPLPAAWIPFALETPRHTAWSGLRDRANRAASITQTRQADRE